jgi:hypothetical protein
LLNIIDEIENNPEENPAFQFFECLHTGSREATFCSGCGWHFKTFKDVYEEMVKELQEEEYSITTKMPYDTCMEEECYHKHFDDDLICEKQFELECIFSEMFETYLKAQDWHRFIPPVLTTVQEQDYQISPRTERRLQKFKRKLFPNSKEHNQDSFLSGVFSRADQRRPHRLASHRIVEVDFGDD